MCTRKYVNIPVLFWNKLLFNGLRGVGTPVRIRNRIHIICGTK